MSVSSKVKNGFITVVLGVFASAAWDGIKTLWGIRVSTSVFRESFQVAYFILIAGIGFFFGKRSARKPLVRHISISSPGLALSLNYGQRISIVQLQMLSAQQVELLCVTLDLRGRQLSGSNFVFTCSNSEPETLQAFVPFTKRLEMKFTEIEILSFDHVLVSLRGYAKFRVAGSQETVQIDFDIPTMPLWIDSPATSTQA
jgi:hypothetical protein